VLQCVAVHTYLLHGVSGEGCRVCCSVLQCVAVCCSVLQCIHTYFMGFREKGVGFVAVCCSVLQCVAVHTYLLHGVSGEGCTV